MSAAICDQERRACFSLRSIYITRYTRFSYGYILFICLIDIFTTIIIYFIIHIIIIIKDLVE